MSDFTGVKAALFYHDKLLVYQRDNKPGLRFAGMWDFFGGGREAGETPFACLCRELQEELDIVIDKDQVVFSKIFPAAHDVTIDAWFMAVDLTKEQAQNFHFGSEGQQWHWMTSEEFLAKEDAVSGMKQRLQAYLAK